MTEKEKEKKLKELLRKLDRPDLARKVGKVSPEILLTELSKSVPEQLKKPLQDIIKKSTQFFATQKVLKEQKQSTTIDQQLVEAMLKGIHPVKYKENKALPLEEKLKLPAWEMICSLQYKEKSK